MATSTFPQERLLHDMTGPLRSFPVLPHIPWCFRQLTGECGAWASDLQTWTAVFDEFAGGEENFLDRSLLILSICAPFGDYELELQTESYSDAAFGMQGRTSWEILNGADEVMMVEADLAEMLPPQWLRSSIFAR